jgi:hypothetical protein
MPDGRLLHLRDTYPVETGSAPSTSGMSCARSAPPPSAATTAPPRPNKALADGYQALEQAYRQRETIFATVMADRADWEAAARAQRHLTVAADAELRRRHPGQYFAPLRSAEPEPATGADRDDLTLTPDAPPGEIDQQLTDLAAGHRTFAGKLADRQSQMIPSEDPITMISARRFPSGPARAGSRSCSRPSPRSRPPRASCSARRTATPTGRPPIDGGQVRTADPEVTAVTTAGVPGARPAGVLRDDPGLGPAAAYLGAQRRRRPAPAPGPGVACPG